MSFWIAIFYLLIILAIACIATCIIVQVIELLCKVPRFIIKGLKSLVSLNNRRTKLATVVPVPLAATTDSDITEQVYCATHLQAIVDV